MSSRRVITRSCSRDNNPVSKSNPVQTPRKGTRLVTSKRIWRFAATTESRNTCWRHRGRDRAQAAEAQIAHLAHHDPLTDLPNRAAFNEHLAATLDSAHADGEQFALLCIDLDRFKEVNDVFGHAVGDELLLRDRRRRLQDGGGRRLPRAARRRRVHRDRRRGRNPPAATRSPSA